MSKNCDKILFPSLETPLEICNEIDNLRDSMLFLWNSIELYAEVKQNWHAHHSYDAYIHIEGAGNVASWLAARMERLSEAVNQMKDKKPIKATD